MTEEVTQSTADLLEGTNTGSILKLRKQKPRQPEREDEMKKASVTANQNCASNVEAETTDTGARNAQPEGSAAMPTTSSTNLNAPV